MLLKELIETRKSPEKNPKQSINSIVIDAVEAAKNDIVAGTTNLFVSFTKIDKLGINPSSKYDTPVGIYAYPGEYVIDTVGAYNPMENLPFAGESPYVNLFSVSGNIIDISTITAEEVLEYVDKIKQLWIKESGKDAKEAEAEIEEIWENATPRRKSYAGGWLWYITWKTSLDLFSPKWRSNHPVSWNKLFRLLGIDGVVDTKGRKIIHEIEPTQAVVFTRRVLKNIKRYHNKYSPDVTHRRTQAGRANQTNLEKIREFLKTASDPKEVYDFLRQNYMLQHISAIKDQKIRSYILRFHPDLIEYLKNPSIEDQLTVLLNRGTDYISFIQRPSEEAFLTALGDEVFRFDDTFSIKDFLKKFPNPSEKLQLAITRGNYNTIPYFVKIYPSTVKQAIEYFAKSKIPRPDWLLKLAKQMKIPADQLAINKWKAIIAELKDSIQLVYKEFDEIMQDVTPERHQKLQSIRDREIASIEAEITKVEALIKTTAY